MTLLKQAFKVLIVAALSLFAYPLAGRAQTVTPEEARAIAEDTYSSPWKI